jgi:hypothetical protein
VLVAREGYYDQEQTVFYAINPGVYYSLSRFMEIEVVGGGVMAAGTVFVGEGEWSLEPPAALPASGGGGAGDGPCAG